MDRQLNDGDKRSLAAPNRPNPAVGPAGKASGPLGSAGWAVGKVEAGGGPRQQGSLSCAVAACGSSVGGQAVH